MKLKKVKESKETPLVKMEDIHKWYGKVHALRGISLEVCPGEIGGSF